MCEDNAAIECPVLAVSGWADGYSNAVSGRTASPPGLSYGVANLTHHAGAEGPEPLEPGRRYQVRVQLNGMALSFPPGHKVRLSISTSYWPLVWPSPRSTRLALYTGTSRLVLPVRHVDPSDDEDAPTFDEPEGAPPIPVTSVQSGEQGWTVTRDLARDSSALEVVKDLGIVHFDDIDLSVTRRTFERYGFVGDDFNSVHGETDWHMGFARGDWDVHVTTRTVLTSTETQFRLHAQLDAYEGEERVASKSWTSDIPRDLI